MSSTKALLRGARDKLSKRDYFGAKEAATQVLDLEPNNYNANVFLAFALLELGELEKSEKIYRTATTDFPDQTLAWQGLYKLYERTGKWDEFAECLEQLLGIHVKSGNLPKLVETLQKLIDLRRAQGTRLQLTKTLMMILPGSATNNILLGLPEPDETNSTSSAMSYIGMVVHEPLHLLNEIVSLMEAEEASQFDREFEHRRMRLGVSKPEQLKKEILKEICDGSKLPELYYEILNNLNTSDELRRSVDAKLIRYKQRHLYSIPLTKDTLATKRALRLELKELIDGVVLLDIPDEFAWTTFLETQDYEEISDIDPSIFISYIRLFPASILSKIIKGYRLYYGNSLENPEEHHFLDAEEVGLDLLLNAYNIASGFLLASRVLSQVYLDLEDYENSIETAKRGLDLLAELEFNSGQPSLRTRTGLQNILATSFVHLSPKRHLLAMNLFDEILKHSPDNCRSLMGRGYILQDRQDWVTAQVIFERVEALNPDFALRAREESAWCMSQMKMFDAAIADLQDVLNILESRERELDIARCLWRLGQTYWGFDDSRRENAHKYFIASLKKNTTFAPAFTSLGLYYLEYASPPDSARASKCFQKAFELDPRETVAARNLTEGFAADREWDLVEVVARRTIEGEHDLDPKAERDDITSTSGYSPSIAWAWKAVGVVELDRGNVSSAIHALQIALRVDSDDETLLLRLGEAYSKAGRHSAAIKAFERCHDLHPETWICYYSIGEARLHFGQYAEAISIFEDLLKDRPLELAVLTSVAQAHLNLGQLEWSQGFLQRAETSFVAAAVTALTMVLHHPGFRSVAWKIASDSAYHLSHFPLFTDENNVRKTLKEISKTFRNQDSILTTLLGLPNLQGQPLSGVDALHISILSAEYRLQQSPNKTPSHSASYDLGVSLQAWLRQNPGFTELNNLSVQWLVYALQGDPKNRSYWTALGNAYYSTNLKAAQHCYIKALEIDPKNALTWSNLGLLYTYHEDYDLAYEAFRRAQALDPGSTLPWTGQAFVATYKGNEAEATALFSHAVELGSTIPEADYNFGCRTFQSAQSHPSRSSTMTSRILPAFFLLNRYCTCRPNDATGLHLFGLTCESLGHTILARELVDRAIGILETAYEVSEDPTVEKQYTLANATLGRLDLALGNTQKSITSFDSVTGLLQIGDDAGPVLHAQSHIGRGLAHWLENDFPKALSLFQEANMSANINDVLQGQTCILLAQTMWSIGTLEFKEMAKAQILDCIAHQPLNLSAINALAGMGILTDDDDLIDASLAEMLALPIDERHILDPNGNVGYLLTQHELNQNNLRKALLIGQKRLFEEPSDRARRNEVASLALRTGNANASLLLLQSDERELHCSTTSLILQTFASTLGNEPGGLQRAVRRAQRAIMLSPYRALCWQALAYVQVSRSRA